MSAHKPRRPQIRIHHVESKGVNLDNEILSLAKAHISQSPVKSLAGKQLTEALIFHGCQCIQAFTDLNKEDALAMSLSIAKEAMDRLYDEPPKEPKKPTDPTKN